MSPCPRGFSATPVRACALAICGAVAIAAPLGAQESGAAPGSDFSLDLGGASATTGLLASPVVTLDQDALFSNSAFGQRVQRALEKDRAALAQENRRIEAALVQEELQLTQIREETPPGTFAEMADAFDRKVQQMREAQDSKSVQLQQRLDRERQTFLNEAGPVLAELVRRRGAYVVIDRNAILLAFDGVDITTEAVAAIDAAIGSGDTEQLTPSPSQRPTEAGNGDGAAQ